MGAGLGLFRPRPARPAFHQARPLRPDGRCHAARTHPARLRHRREHRAAGRGRRGAGVRRIRRDADRPRPGRGWTRTAGRSATIRLSYVDDGDWIDLARFKACPGAGKRRVRPREIAYRAPVHSRRNVFGAYTLYDLMARLVLGDTASYSTDRAEAFDARSGVNVTVELERRRGVLARLIATPDSGLRMTALNFRCCADRRATQPQAHRRSCRPARLDLGASPTRTRAAAARLFAARRRRRMMAAVRELVGDGPVGVIAAASAEASRTAAATCACWPSSASRPSISGSPSTPSNSSARTRPGWPASRRCAASCSAAATRSAWSRPCCTAARKARCCAPSPVPTPGARC